MTALRWFAAIELRTMFWIKGTDEVSAARATAKLDDTKSAAKTATMRMGRHGTSCMGPSSADGVRMASHLGLRRAGPPETTTAILGSVPNHAMDSQITDKPGLIAALDQSGGSTPGALRLYGIPDSAYSSNEQMFALMHQMRVRVMTAPAFTEKIIATIYVLLSALGAQALGWYRYARGEYDDAAWFKAALDWWPPPRTTPPEALAPVDDYRPILAHLALGPRTIAARRAPIPIPRC